MRKFKKFIQYYFPSNEYSHSDADCESYFVFMICFIKHDSHNIVLKLNVNNNFPDHVIRTWKLKYFLKED